MTPKEKSEELLKKFSSIQEWVGGEGNISAGHKIGLQAAIICVEQIIGEWTELNNDPDTETLWSEEKCKYWNHVLEHLKNA